MKKGPDPSKSDNWNVMPKSSPIVGQKTSQKSDAGLEPSEWLKKAVTSAGDGVWDWDLVSNCIVFSPRWKEMIGYQDHELRNLYEEWATRVHPEDLDRAEADIKAHISGETPSYACEFRMRCKNGEWKWILDRGLVTRRDSKGRALRMIGTHVDITARKRVEEALQESEERWKFALEGAGDGLWDWNTVSGAVLYSRRWKEMLGYREDEIGDGFDEWKKRVHDDDLPSALAAVTAHLEGRTPSLNFEVRMLTKSGRWKWILSRGLVTSRDRNGKPLRMIGTHVDITDRKEAREREARNLEMVAAGAEIPAVLDAIIRAVEAEHPDMLCLVKLVGGSGAVLEVASAPSLPQSFKRAIQKMEIASGGGCACAAVRTGQRVVVEDILLDKQWAAHLKRAHAAKLRACWVEPIRSSDGRVLGAFSIYHRATHLPKPQEISSISHATQLIAVAVERKRAEDALKESEKKFRAIFEQAAVGVALIDSHTGRFITVNQRYCDMLGFTAGEMEKITFMTITYPEDLQPDLDLMARMKAGEIRHFKIEKRLKRADGALIWVNLAVAALWEPNAAPDRHVAIVEDITSRKQAEEALRESEQMNRALLDNTSALIVVTDRAGRITHVNQAVTSQFGYTLDNVADALPWETGVMKKEDKPKSKERFKRLLAGGENPAREFQLRGKDGQWHLVETRSTCTRRADGTIDRFIITGTDLTERRRLEQEVLKISEQEQANIGHNLHDGVGQTLTGIGSLLDSLEDRLEGDDKAAAGRIRDLMRQAVAEVRRMSHGLSPVAVQNRGLAGGLQLLAETIRTNYRRDGVCEIEPGITIDDAEKEANLFRIAQEAVNNSLRHGGAKQIRIGLKRLSETECSLQVIDNGKGFDHSSKTPKNGIGLRVMRYRANLIGADLDVESKPREGVTITCRFPCSTAPKKKRSRRTTKDQEET